MPDDCRLVTAMIATAAHRSRAGSAVAGSERRFWVGLSPLVAVSQAASGREFLAFGSGLTTHSIVLGNRKLDMPVLHGSCLCGGIKYEITGPLLRPQNCHCSRCRKAQGAAFRSLARVRTGDFRWIQGEELVKYFESSPGFCRGSATCAARLLSTGLGQTGPWLRRNRRHFLNSASPSERSMTTPAFGRSATSMLAARHHGSRSPTICPNMTSFRDSPKRGIAAAQRGMQALESVH